MNFSVSVFVLLILIGSCVPASAQDAATALKITPEQFDFGTVDEGKTATTTAVVQNTGGAAIEIVNVRTS
jgi:hypothetical protein